jgi:hypothetical protein
VFIQSRAIVSRKEFTAFRMAPELMKAMRAVKVAEGIPVSEQVDRAVRAYLEARGLTVKKTERKRAVTRKRS